jgi:DNA helicase-2/ATP-dependent DNA helicase PcrA
VTTLLPGAGAAQDAAPPLTPDALRALLGIPFSTQQLDAITAPPEPCVIVAGAGSGKTTVMAARVVWLVGTGVVAPDRVLGLTFTNKAAAELSGRVRLALARLAASAGHHAEQAGLLGEPTVSTYHSYAGRLITDHGLRIGVEPSSRLLADVTRYQLATRVLRQHRGDVHHLTSPIPDIAAQILALDGELGEHLVAVGDVRRWHEGWRADAVRALATPRAGQVKKYREAVEKLVACAAGREELLGFVEAYREQKRRLDALDFSDQVALAARLATEHPDVAAAERAAYEVVLLDEYQDTSVAQRTLLTALFGQGHAVTAVGDPCQAIYGWRGASVANLDDFGRHFRRSDGSEGGRLQLTVNRRSGGRLLALANTLSKDLRARHVVAELEPPPERADAGSIEVALDLTVEDEQQRLAARLREVVDAGTPPGECAVLVRKRSSFPGLFDALTAVGLPVEVVGIGGLLETPAVVELLAVLELLDDPAANPALTRLLTGPRWAVGARDLALLGRRAADLVRGAGADGADGADVAGVLAGSVGGNDPADIASLLEALEDPGPLPYSEEARARFRALAGQVRQLRAVVSVPLDELITRVLEVSGLAVEIAALPESAAEVAGDAVAAFVDLASGFTTLEGQSSLSSFLAYLHAQLEHDEGVEGPGARHRDAVALMTVHKAKGLEWDVVALPHLADNVFPSDTVRNVWTRAAQALPAPLRGDAASLPECVGCGEAELAAFDKDAKAHQKREEDRLAYVAVTRPRHLLLASAHWWGPTQKERRGPSRLLTGIVEHVRATGGRIVAWAEAPEKGQTNPLLGRQHDIAWPLPEDTDALAVRRAVAAEVAAVRRADPATLPDADAGLTPEERRRFAELDADLDLLVERARSESRAVVEVQLPRTLSASTVLRVAEDPEAYAREVARPLPRPASVAARRGTRFHAWVEQLWEERPLLGPEDLPGAEDEGVEEVLALDDLRAAFLASRWANRRPHRLEVPFELAVGGTLVRGRLDAVYACEDGSWEVVDWKTGAEGDPLQLALYRAAWAELAGVPVERVRAGFVFVARGTEQWFDDLPDAAAVATRLSRAFDPGPGDGDGDGDGEVYG